MCLCWQSVTQLCWLQPPAQHSSLQASLVEAEAQSATHKESLPKFSGRKVATPMASKRKHSGEKAGTSAKVAKKKVAELSE